MPLSLKNLSRTSLLHHWIKALAITEVPTSYIVATALSAIGCLLRRQVWVDQVEWRVHPNLSVLLVGPSGIGKDVAIRKGEEIVESITKGLAVGGKTMEGIVKQLVARQSDPCCALISAPELTAFLGGKDYQKSMVQELTDLLSTGQKVDVSLSSTGERFLMRPTITMMAGSTKEWLHKSMPEGSLEGGLFPRFLILCEEYGNKNIPLIKHSIMEDERSDAQQSRQFFLDSIRPIINYYAQNPQEIDLSIEAIDFYQNWYFNRFNYFSPTVRPYANRSRDMLLRIAMLLAILNGRGKIELEDMKFGRDILNYVGSSIDQATIPSTKENRIGQELVEILPATTKEILQSLTKKYTMMEILKTIEYLTIIGRIRKSPTNSSQFEKAS